MMLKFVIEILYFFGIGVQSRKRVHYNAIEIERSLSYQRILDRINDNVSYHQILSEFPKIKYVLLREAVYDISDFAHPGGRFIIESLKGKELGRYIYGGYSLSSELFAPHKHSEFAINYLETRYIGSFLNETCPLIYE